MPPTTTWRVIRHDLGLKPYHVQYTHALTRPQCLKRVSCCEVFDQMIEMEPEVKKKIIFSDEATFHISGKVNRHSCVFWGLENPRVVREYTRNTQKVNVWCGVTASKVIGPFFFPSNINGRNYLEMLSNFLMDELPLTLVVDGYFQQDGAPAHYARDVKDFLNAAFPGRWIGRGGPIDWPAYSPDLNPCDFWLWGMLKNTVYSHPVRTLDELKLRIIEAVESIPAEMCKRVIDSAFQRFKQCAANDGTQVERL